MGLDKVTHECKIAAQLIQDKPFQADRPDRRMSEGCMTSETLKEFRIQSQN
jgi:hypothetical protein